MKMRQLKKFNKLVKIGKTITKHMFEISRKKDNALMTTVSSKLEAMAFIKKTKASKKAAVYISNSYREKQFREPELAKKSMFK